MTTIIPFVHEGLGNSSYLVGLADGEALLVDPDRSVQRYLAAAAAQGWRITRVFETHLHADFVTGSLEIAAATGARLFVPDGASAAFAHIAVGPGDEIPLPGGTMESIASAGHTPEHTSFALRQQGDVPRLFSGGSLMAGGAARTDLISASLTDTLSRAQFRSITTAFTSLPDETVLLPTHGGGSFCSAGAGGERTSTLGYERATNPLLAMADEEEFVRWFPTTFPAAPDYFFRLRAVNQAGPQLRRNISPPPALEPREFDLARQNAVVVDVRPQAGFMAGHIPGSVGNTLRDGFATWLGWLIPADARLLFVAGDEPIERVLEECLLVGYERFAGVLRGGMAAWVAACLPVTSWELAGLARASRLIADGFIALDVREPDEFAAGHLPGATHIPLGQLQARFAELSRDRPILTYCGHGERAATALSLLERAGFSPLANLDGGFESWSDSRLPVATGMEVRLN